MSKLQYPDRKLKSYHNNYSKKEKIFTLKTSIDVMYH